MGQQDNDEFKWAAAECLSHARAIVDPVARLAFLANARKLLDLLEKVELRARMDVVYDDFNERQMTGRTKAGHRGA